MFDRSVLAVPELFSQYLCNGGSDATAPPLKSNILSTEEKTSVDLHSCHVGSLTPRYWFYSKVHLFAWYFLEVVTHV